jgi:sec-independent protein translocase protein TatA
MFGLGLWELLLILFVILVVFSRKLPDVGEGLAKAIRNFRRTIREPDEIDVTPKDRSQKGTDKKSS